MTEKIKDRLKICVIWATALSLIPIAFSGCKKAPARILKVGIVSTRSTNVTELEGFKAGMAELGYVENKNIEYIHNGDIGINNSIIDAEIKKLLVQDIDLFVTFGEGVALRAKELLKETNMPVIFAAEAWPVEDGLVKSLKHPGGNMTGIRPADSLPKTMEWLVKITPNAKKVCLPYNPDDKISTSEIPVLEKAAAQLGIELVHYKTSSVEVAVAAIGDLSKDIDAIYLMPSPTLNPGGKELSQAAIKRRIPIGSSLLLDESILITMTSNYFDAGKKMARLAQQVFEGTKPADLPVETPDVLLIFNVKTAKTIGINIPDDILAQATSIIR